MQEMLEVLFQNQGFGGQGYYAAMLAQAPNKVAFADEYQKVSALFAAYQKDPSSANIQALGSGMQDLLNLL